MSSSSDEDIFLLENVFLKMRKQSVHPINRKRKIYGEYHHLFQDIKADKQRFYRYTRMTPETFYYILDKVEHRLIKNWCNWHQQPILPEERLVVTIRYLATGATFAHLASEFRMGLSTIKDIIEETTNVLWDELHPVHMPIPTKEAFRAIANDFNNIWNFPNVLGAIDGKHVRILCPDGSGSMFYNYKKYFSVVLQAVADANYKFITIDIGGFGKQSDGGTFKASELYQRLSTGQMDIPEAEYLPGTNVKTPYVFLGDEAYPLLRYLLKPFGGRNLPSEQRNFNKRLSRARKTIECAFGIVNSKWRLLSKCIETNIDVADQIVKCICVLHNTIIDKEGINRNLTPVHLVRRRWNNSGHDSNEAMDIRNIYVNYFLHNSLAYNN
ncbi:unnamed protein product [Acanthoscelides obtectus]|uniref:DDE Tnp4 domain-containing protein n=1 Tax=Acanthoscelides obtectus TaxID=200917 RepID=A0A9P0L5B2_ACAOB|nr:unnamed protein product [Acanthoscelides obtectus]CAK1650829.1 Protein ALP1-like [Acanthoscelides obtectus]